MLNNFSLAISHALCDLSEDRSSPYHGYTLDDFRTALDTDSEALVSAVKSRFAIPWYCTAEYFCAGLFKRIIMTLKNMFICNAGQIHIPDGTEQQIAAEIGQQMLLNIDDLMKVFKCSRSKAHQITKIKDFPPVRIDSMTLVEPLELKKWLLRYRGRHVYTKIK